MDEKPIVVLGDLDGPEGNAYVILGSCHRAFVDFHRERGTYRSGLEAPGEKPDAELRWQEIFSEMTSGDYKNLLAVVDREFVVAQRVAVYQQVSALAASDALDERLAAY